MRIVLTPQNRPGKLSVLSEEETVRSYILSAARSCTMGFVLAGMVNIPVMAASAKPLGMIVIADKATVDHANAAVGADLFSGDALSTNLGGSLRMKLGASQVYLLSATDATLVPVENRLQAKLSHGTLGFSTTSPEQLEIGTPLGVVRGADNQRVFAQVAVLSPTKMQISVYEGTLLAIAPNGDRRTIEQGETLEGTIAAPEPGGGQNQYGVGGTGVNWKHVAEVAIIGGIVGGTALGVWIAETESCSNPPCN
jgi:hypothetical protein